MDGADVGMVQGGSSLASRWKRLESLGILGHVVGQEFEGNEPVQAVSSAL